MKREENKGVLDAQEVFVCVCVCAKSVFTGEAFQCEWYQWNGAVVQQVTQGGTANNNKRATSG